jgi:hypothetical protein
VVNIILTLDLQKNFSQRQTASAGLGTRCLRLTKYVKDSQPIFLFNYTYVSEKLPLPKLENQINKQIYFFLTSALDGGRGGAWSTPRPAVLPV